MGIANDGILVGDALGFLEEGDGVGFEFGLEAVEDLFDGEGLVFDGGVR